MRRSHILLFLSKKPLHTIPAEASVISFAQLYSGLFLSAEYKKNPGCCCTARRKGNPEGGIRRISCFGRVVLRGFLRFRFWFRLRLRHMLEFILKRNPHGFLEFHKTGYGISFRFGSFVNCFSGHFFTAGKYIRGRLRNCRPQRPF